MFISKTNKVEALNRYGNTHYQGILEDRLKKSG